MSRIYNRVNKLISQTTDEIFSQIGVRVDPSDYSYKFVILDKNIIFRDQCHPRLEKFSRIIHRKVSHRLNERFNYKFNHDFELVLQGVNDDVNIFHTIGVFDSDECQLVTIEDHRVRSKYLSPVIRHNPFSIEALCRQSSLLSKVNNGSTCMNYSQYLESYRKVFGKFPDVPIIRQ